MQHTYRSISIRLSTIYINVCVCVCVCGCACCVCNSLDYLSMEPYWSRKAGDTSNNAILTSFLPARHKSTIFKKKPFQNFLILFLLQFFSQIRLRLEYVGRYIGDIYFNSSIYQYQEINSGWNNLWDLYTMSLRTSDQIWQNRFFFYGVREA